MSAISIQYTLRHAWTSKKLCVEMNHQEYMTQDHLIKPFIKSNIVEMERVMYLSSIESWSSITIYGD